MEKIKVNMTPCEEAKTIHASQNDNATRKWAFDLYDENGKIDSSDIKEQMIFDSRVGGTEQILPENTSDPTTSPIIADIQYPDSLRSEQTFLYRESPTSENGQAKITHIKGNTLVWNQLVQNGNFADTSVWVNGASYISGGKLTLQKRTGGTDQYVLQNVPFVSGHKYLLLVDAKATDTATTNFTYVQAVSLGVSSMFITSTTRQLYFRKETAIESSNKRILVQNGYDSGVEVYNIMVTDLTQLGQDLSADQFTSLFSLPYYDYTTGKLLSFKGEELKTTGKNLLDQNASGCLVGKTILVDGSIIDAPDVTVSDYIRVEENVSLNYSSATNNPAAYNKRIVCFDGNKNFIGTCVQTSGNPSGSFSITGTTVSGTVYVRVPFVTALTDGMLEIGSTASTYEPYQESTLSLPSSAYFPTGMKSLGTVYDELTESKAITRVGSYTITGQETVTGFTNVGTYNRCAIVIPFSSGQNEVQSLWSIGAVRKYSYTEDSWHYYVENGKIWYFTTKTTSSDILAEIQNTTIFYELATPTEESITTASLVTEKGEAPLYYDDELIADCNETISSESGIFDAKIKLMDDNTIYSQKIQLHVERKPQ